MGKIAIQLKSHGKSEIGCKLGEIPMVAKWNTNGS